MPDSGEHKVGLRLALLGARGGRAGERCKDQPAGALASTLWAARSMAGSEPEISAAVWRASWVGDTGKATDFSRKAVVVAWPGDVQRTE